MLTCSLHLISQVETMLQLEEGTLVPGLTKRKVKAGANWVQADNTPVQSYEGRDALSRNIYSKLFDHLIAKINAALLESSAPMAKDDRVIGVVDIFGFEFYEVNSLEQLCINYTNEKLQQIFTKSVFIQTVQACKEDGIECESIAYTDNAMTIQLFEAPQDGIWDLLFDECIVPQGADSKFTEKLHRANQKLVKTIKGDRSDRGLKEGFEMQHFAGKVEYATTGWLAKNKDPLSGDLVALMQCSDNETLSAIFTDVLKPLNKGQRFKSNKFRGVVDNFRTQLGELCAVLEASQNHFVRCFKPNDNKAPDQWNDETVVRQLHASGVLDALRVSRTGYPDWVTFQEFVMNYASLAGEQPKWEGWWDFAIYMHPVRKPPGGLCSCPALLSAAAHSASLCCCSQRFIPLTELHPTPPPTQASRATMRRTTPCRTRKSRSQLSRRWVSTHPPTR